MLRGTDPQSNQLSPVRREQYQSEVSVRNFASSNEVDFLLVGGHVLKEALSSAALASNGANILGGYADSGVRSGLLGDRSEVYDRENMLRRKMRQKRGTNSEG